MTNKTLREELLAATKEERVKILFDYLNKHGDKHYEEYDPAGCTVTCP
jgi:hypothetical protein